MLRIILTWFGCISRKTKCIFNEVDTCDDILTQYMLNILPSMNVSTYNHVTYDILSQDMLDALPDIQQLMPD
jgi:hypothetical protein